MSIRVGCLQICLLASVSHAQHELIIISPEPGWNSLTAAEINDAGQVLIHRVRDYDVNNLPEQWSAVWQDGQWSPLTIPPRQQLTCNGSTTTWPEWRYVVGNAMNNLGTVAGRVSNGNCQQRGATWSSSNSVQLWDRAGFPLNCQNPDGVPANLLAIGDGGLVGGITCGNIISPGYAIMGVSESHFDSITAPSGGPKTVVDINANGRVLGHINNGSGSITYGYWTSTSQFVSLGTGSGTSKAINDLGWMLLDRNTGGFDHVIIRDGIEEPIDSSDVPTNLRLGTGIDINDVGSILGSNAVLIDEQRYNLDSLGLAGLFSSRAVVAINNSNWIVGHGRLVGAPSTENVVWILKPDVECFRLTQQPEDVQVSKGADIAFEVEGTSPAVGYTWLRDGVALADGMTSWGSEIVGAASSQLEIRSVRGEDAGIYICVLSDACGMIESDPATLTIQPCPPDTNNDGTLSPADFSAWIAAFNTQSPACDQNADDLCTPSDFSAWIANYNAGC